MDDANRKLLAAGLTTLGLNVSDKQVERLVGYHDYLLDYNRSVNLTGLRDERDSVIGNMLNSLAPWRHVDLTKKTADVGTGGGLPGLPLAIALNMSSLGLVESKQKKCAFLREACRRFAPDVRVIEADVNTVEEPFDQVVSVAYGTLGKLVKTTSRLRSSDCVVLAWKGKKTRIAEEIEECEPAFNGWEVQQFDVPGLDAERHLCVLRP